MIKKKVIIAIMTAMIMTNSLTACQKSEGDTENDVGQSEGDAENDVGQSEGATESDAGQTEDLMEEMTGASVVEREGTIAEQEMQQQKNSALLEILTNSPEYLACAEWWDFCKGYDTDFKILEQAGNEPVEAGYEYEAYNCYSPDMEEKIDEICEKYSLSKLSGFRIVDDYSELCIKAGVGDFCERESENVKQTVTFSYMYDGEFLMEGNAILAASSINEVSYQFVRVAKGYFTSAHLDFGDLAEYNVREYTTKKGEKVFFAGAEDTNVYIIAEREKSFIVINVLGDMSGITDVNDERLKQLADAFDFAKIP